jgi:hypothetical protein
MQPPSTHAPGAQKLDPQEQSLDQLIDKAVEAAAKGENAAQILEIMLLELPANERDKAKKRFAAALAKRGLRAPGGEADIPSRTVLARIRRALALSTRQMMERILMLVRLRPDLAARIQQAGRVLAKHGVQADKVTVTESDLGTIVPSAGIAAAPDRGAGRG